MASEIIKKEATNEVESSEAMFLKWEKEFKNLDKD